MTQQPRVLIVAENASAKFGGEAILPLHYFRLLRARGIEVWMVVNQRTQWELQTLPADQLSRVHFVPDTRLHRWLERLSRPFPAAVKHFTFRLLGRIVSQANAHRLARQLISEHQIDVVHQPTPVSPREPSLLYGLGAPVIMGPMNGNMTYPPAFAGMQKQWVRSFVGTGRIFSGALNFLMPGKLRAQTLLVANERTRLALPKGCKGSVSLLVENGVDLNLWIPAEHSDRAGQPVRFVFSGRLVDWKGVQFLIEAFAQVQKQMPAELHILGDGLMRAKLQSQAAACKTAVIFHGWIAQSACAKFFAESDVFVLPSVHESGGAVVLEAMAAGLPVIATNWGGPADYLDSTCGVLIDPQEPKIFIQKLAQAMIQLGSDPQRRRTLGEAGRAKCLAQFDWQKKIDQILEIYRTTIDGQTQAG